MVVTLLGIVIEVKEEQPQKAYESIIVTLLGIVNSVTSVPFICIFLWQYTP